MNQYSVLYYSVFCKNHDLIDLSIKILGVNKTNIAHIKISILKSYKNYFIEK